MKFILTVLAIVALTACGRRPAGDIETNMPTGTRLANNWITGSIIKFEDGNVTCYATSKGVSCVQVCK